MTAHAEGPRAGWSWSAVPRLIARTRMPLGMFAVGALVLVVALAAGSTTGVSRPLPAGVARPVSGLAAYDPLTGNRATRELKDSYVFNGSAPASIGYEVQHVGGMVIGVRPHSGWLGWFGVTLDGLPANAVYHVQMSRPARIPAGGVGESVFAVQTALTQRSGAINYVVVAAVTALRRTTWEVGYAHGLIADASTEVFWRSRPQRGGPLVRSISLRTDGRSCLAVWLGGQAVYSGCGLHLNIPGPYQAYLEVQSRDIAYRATFRDFWVAGAGPVKISGARPGAVVSLVSPSGFTIASAASASGDVTLVPPAPMASGIASLVVGGVARGPLRYSTGDHLVWTGGSATAKAGITHG